MYQIAFRDGSELCETIASNLYKFRENLSKNFPNQNHFINSGGGISKESWKSHFEDVEKGLDQLEWIPRQDPHRLPLSSSGFFEDSVGLDPDVLLASVIVWHWRTLLSGFFSRDHLIWFLYLFWFFSFPFWPGDSCTDGGWRARKRPD